MKDDQLIEENRCYLKNLHGKGQLVGYTHGFQGSEVFELGKCGQSDTSAAVHGTEVMHRPSPSLAHIVELSEAALNPSRSLSID